MRGLYARRRSRLRFKDLYVPVRLVVPSPKRLEKESRKQGEIEKADGEQTDPNEPNFPIEGQITAGEGGDESGKAIIREEEVPGDGDAELAGEGGDESGIAIIPGDETPGDGDAELAGEGGEPEAGGAVEIRKGVENLGPIALWAVLQVAGSRKMTEDQYSSVRTMLSTVLQGVMTSESSAPQRLPHYRTITKEIRPTILGNLAVEGAEHKFDIDTTMAGARACRWPENPSKCRVFIASPMDYAAKDFASAYFFNRIQRMKENENPVVRARPWFYGPQQFIDVDDDANSGFEYAEAGDTVDMLQLPKE